MQFLPPTVTLVCRAIPILAVAAILSACSSDDDDSIELVSPASGIWTGSFTSEDSGLTWSHLALVSETGKAHFIQQSPQNDTQYVGSLLELANTPTIMGSHLLTLYGPLVGRVHVIRIESTIFPKDQLLGTYENTTLASAHGTFAFTYDPIYERPSSLAAVSGAWTGNVALTIDAAGNISGDGVSGQIAIIDPRFNVYNIKFTKELTPPPISLKGFSGLATLSDGAVPNDTLTYATVGEVGIECVVFFCFPKEESSTETLTRQ